MHVDYVTEREAHAIRCCASGWMNWHEDFNDMTLRVRIGDDVVIIPTAKVADFMEDWRKSGVWTLYGKENEHEHQG